MRESTNYIYANDDQKRILEAFESQIEPDVNYLFFLPEGAETGGVAGYNPPGYNFGFIYDGAAERTVAHELGHGIGSLRHPFDDAANVRGNTKSLMDYNDGEQLYHFQWDMMQNPKRRIFRWRFDEEEGESVDWKLVYPKWWKPNHDIAGLFINPLGNPFYLSLKAETDSVYVLDTASLTALPDDFETRAVYGFSQNGSTYFCEMQGSEFVRYCKYGTSEPYIDNYEKEAKSLIGSDSSFADTCHVKLWNISLKMFDTSPWFCMKEHHECMYYDSEQNSIIIITDITDPFMFNLGKNKFDFQQVREKKLTFKKFTQKEILDSEYNPIIKNIQRANRGLYEAGNRIFDYLTRKHYIYWFSYFFVSQKINYLSTLKEFDDESIKCLTDLWEGEEGEYVRKKLSHPKETIEEIVLSDSTALGGIIIDEISTLIVKDKSCEKFIDCLVTVISSMIGDEQTSLCLSEFRDEFGAYIKGKLTDGESLKYILKFTGYEDLFKRMTYKFGDFFASEGVTNKMSACLVDCAKSFCEGVETLTEEQKQEIFQNDATKSVGVLLYEFAAGTDKTTREFTDGKFWESYLQGGPNMFNDNKENFINIEEKVKEGFRDDVKTKKLSYLEENDSVLVSLGFSPTSPSVWKKAIDSHRFSNLTQLLVGGANAYVKNIGSKKKFEVHIANMTSRNSLFLHICPDNEETPNKKLNNINQIFKFYIEYDEKIFE